jgi:hypothetical protein
MDESILTEIKKLLGIGDEDTSFDKDVIIHINSAFFSLTQLGVGPSTGFRIADKTKTWGEFAADETLVAGVKDYVYMKNRLIFDPPQTGYLVDAIKSQIEELGWRLNIMVDSNMPPTSTEGGTDCGS